MSYSVDVNLLLYASDEASPRHAEARSFLDRCTVDPETFCIAWLTLMSYLRMSTHPRIFAEPLSPSEALANVEALLRLPQTRVLTEADGFLGVYREVSGGFPVRGNLVPDAHLAALLLQHRVQILYTSDRDFAGFPFFDVRNPFE